MAMHSNPSGAHRGRIAPHPPGGLIAGRFRVLRSIGQGGFGSVYEVEDTVLKVHMACKEMDLLVDPMASGQTRPQMVENFQQEAVALNQLHHPNIPPANYLTEAFNQLVCTECAQAFLAQPACPGCRGKPAFVDQRHYLMMRYLAGKTLAASYEEQGRPRIWIEVRPWFIQVASAVAELHRNKMTHGDLKPENILIEAATSRAYVIDLGLVKAMPPAGTPKATRVLSTKSFAMGTPGYAAPEVYRNQSQAASDIYALGMLLYWALTDQEPTEDFLQMGQKSPREFNPQIPVPVSMAIVRATRAAMQERFATVEEMVAALDLAAPAAAPAPATATGSVPGQPVVPATIVLPTTTVLTTTEQPAVQAPGEGSGLATAYAVLMGLGILTGAIGLFLLTVFQFEGRLHGGDREVMQFSLAAMGVCQLPTIIVFSVWFFTSWNLVAPEYGRRSPWVALGLSFLPVFNLFWMFRVIPGLSTALHKELKARDPNDRGPSGWGWGVAVCIFILATMLVPILGVVSMGLMATWVLKTNGAKNRLLRARMSGAAAGTLPGAAAVSYLSPWQWTKRAAAFLVVSGIIGAGIAYGVQVSKRQKACTSLGEAVERARRYAAQENWEEVRWTLKYLTKNLDCAHTWDAESLLRTAEEKLATPTPTPTRAPSTLSFDEVSRLNLVDLTRLADKGDAAAQTELGARYASGTGVTKDYAQAFIWFKKAADQGHVRGQRRLGYCYMYGFGISKSAADALPLFRKSADQGDGQAMDALGDIYKDGRGVEKDARQAANWYQKAAENGSADGMADYGLALQDGSGVARDLNLAVEWFKKASALNLARAQRYLGLCYTAGLGVTRNDYEAVGLFRKAADAGDSLAQAYLGGMYATGRGVPKDEKDAVYWFGKSADQGDAQGQVQLGNAYFLGNGVAKDRRRAVELFRLSADQGNARAQFYLGLLYLNGVEVGKDPPRGVGLLRQAADQGHAGAQAELGNVYRQGIAVARDPEKALELIRKAADQGLAQAYRYLGDCYRDGTGVVRDREEAARWYRKAIENGDADARDSLSKL